MAEPLVQAGMVRRRHAFLCIAVAALLVAGIACTCNNLPIPSLNPTTVPPTEAGTSGGKPGGGAQPSGGQSGGSQGAGTIDLTVYNGTGNSIWYIYISPTTSSTWGDDWLGSSTLSAGETISFSVPAGSYDLRADDSSHNVVEQQMGVALTSPYTWTITGSGGSSGGGGGATIALTLVNQASSTVCYVRISPTSSSSWGDDWLGADTISAGASYTFSVPSGDYDLRAEFCGGGQVEEHGVSLYSDQSWYVSGGGSSGGSSPSGGGTIDLTVYNGTGNSIWYIYISPTTSSSWGDDWLGSSTLSAGETTSFSVPAGSYDLKAEDSSHNVVEQQMGVNLSSSYTWYITGSGGGSSPSGGGTINLTVYNGTGSSIWYIYISPTTSSSWGDDWLGSSTLSAGETISFSVPAGSYDLRADDSSHNVVEQQMGVSLSSSYTWYITGSGGGSSPSGGGTINLTVYNGTGNSIWYIYISPTTSSSWGDDWLGSSTLSAGETTSFSVPAGSYDLKAEDSGHNVVEQQMGVNLSSSYTWYITGSGGGSSGGSGASLTVYNYTSSSVCYMRISPTTSSSWGDDWLGADTISSGASYTFSVTPGSYDLRAEYCGGGNSTQMGVSISGNITWTLQ